MAVKAHVFEYAVELDAAWTATSDRGGGALPRDDAWTPEHLVLAGLCRCTLTSLSFHARRARVQAVSSARARGVVTRRESDGRFAFVEVGVDFDVALDPLPADGGAELVRLAERDCFVGASLTAAPSYAWTVNGARP